MIAGELFHTIQSNTEYSGAAFWADSVSPRRNIMLPWGGEQYLKFHFHIFTSVRTDRWGCAGCFLQISADVSLVCLRRWAKGRRGRNTNSQTRTWCFFYPCCVFFQLRFHILSMAELPCFANSQSWTGCTAVNSFWHICFIETYFSGNKSEIWFALLTLFDGDLVSSISTIWSGDLSSTCPPPPFPLGGCKFMTRLLWELRLIWEGLQRFRFDYLKSFHMIPDSMS